MPGPGQGANSLKLRVPTRQKGLVVEQLGSDVPVPAFFARICAYDDQRHAQLDALDKLLPSDVMSTASGTQSGHSALEVEIVRFAAQPFRSG